MPVNSHFMPQLLLKGFAFRNEGQEFYVHVFRKGSTSFQTNTRNVAAQRNFYGDEKIERVLSSWEGQFADVVLKLRQAQCTPDDKPLIDRFVAHSLVRTRRFRDGVHAIGTAVMEKGFREFLNPELTPHLIAKLANDIMNEPQIKDILAQVAPEKRPHLQMVMRQMLEHPDMHGALRRMILQTLPTIDTVSSVRSAQRQVLEDDKHLDKRIRDLERINWRIEMYLPNALVLGDIGPLVKGDGSSQWGSIFCGTPEMVWFPLSHNCLLIGEINPVADSAAAEEVNLLSVGNSCEFFVASQRTTREKEYQRHLGLRALELSEEELSGSDKAIKDYLMNLGGTLTTDG